MKCFQLLSVFLAVSCSMVAQPFDSIAAGGAEHAAGAGWLHRWVFGDLWRDAWEICSRSSSRVLMADSSLLPSRLRSLLTAEAREDLQAAYHPYASHIACALASAIYTRKAPGESASSCGDTIGTDTLLSRIRAGGIDRIDAGLYLRLRLLDWVVANEAEDASSWLWTADTVIGQRTWSPVKHDLSRAFARFDGLFGFMMPIFLGKLPDVERARYDGEPRGTLRELDRRILPEMDWRIWDAAVTEVKTRLTDSVIASTIALIPADIRARGACDLTPLLRQRRSALREAAREWYEKISETVDVFGSDGEDLGEIAWNANAGVRVVVRGKANGGLGGKLLPRFDRSFEKGTTSEIRVHLLGGDDLIVLRGEGRKDIRVVILGGDGDDEVLDERNGGQGTSVQVYDVPGTRIAGTSGIRLRAEPNVSTGNSSGGVLREDRGTHVSPGLVFEVNADVGVLFGGGPVWTRYGLFDDPYALQMSVLAGYSPFVKSGRIVFESSSYSLLPGVSAFFHARASGVERVRFFGFGNDADLTKSASDDYYRVSQSQYRAEGGIRAPRTGALSVSISGIMAFTRTHLNGSRLIDQARPFGVGGIFDAALCMKVLYDTRDFPFLPRDGNIVQLGLELHPAWLDLPEGYGKAFVDVHTYLPFTLPLEGTLGFREYGEVVWGRFPYYAAAFLGGAETLRGYYDGRFSGDAVFALGSELRITAGTVNFVMPTKVGLLGFAETGQLYTRALGAGKWHTSFGGGVWAAPALKDLTMTLRVGFSRESTILYFDAAVGM